MTAATRPAYVRDAWVVVGGQSASTVGDALLLVVLPLLVLDRTGSPWQVSLLVVVAEAPAFLGFLSGWPRRHLPARTLLVWYDLIRAGLVSGIALAVAAGGLAPVYVLAFLLNLASALFRPTRIEFLAQVVPVEGLRRFNSYDRTLEAVGTAAGAGVGGYLYGVLPLPAVLVAGAATFAAAGGSLLALRSGAGPAEAAQDRVRTTFRQALASVRRQTVLVYLLAGETLTGAAFGIFLSVFVVYARRLLGVGSTTFGLFEVAQALAATATGVLLGAGWLRLRDERLAVLGYLGMGLSMVALGLNRAVWPVFLVMVVLGVTNMFYAVSVRTLLQSRSRPEEVIHVFAAESVLSRAAQIAGAAAAGGVLAIAPGSVGAVLTAAGALVVAVAAWGRSALLRDEPVAAR